MRNDDLGNSQLKAVFFTHLKVFHPLIMHIKRIKTVFNVIDLHKYSI